MAEILSGRETAKAIDENIAKKVRELAENGITACLAVVRVGSDPADISYEKSIIKKAGKAGVDVRVSVIENDVNAYENVCSTIKTLNSDDKVHGILLFRPLPKGIDEDSVIELIDPSKDVDGVTKGSLVSVFTGKGSGYAPCTAQACIEILDFYGIEPKGKDCVVIGRSLVVGKPLAMLLLNRNSTVTVCHTKTGDLPSKVRRADIVFAAAGRGKMIDSGYLCGGQTVIDVGINFDENGKMCGDVDFESAEGTVAAITPVPGGVGSVTTSVLLLHTVDSAVSKCLH